MGNQIDLAGMIITAVLGAPAVWWEAYLANPEPWNQVGLMMLGVVALSVVGNRLTRRRRRAR